MPPLRQYANIFRRDPEGQYPLREVYSIGQVARMLHVAPATVAGWIDHGRLPGFRLPPSGGHRPPSPGGNRSEKGDRRVTHTSLVAFLEAHFNGQITPEDLWGPGWREGDDAWEIDPAVEARVLDRLARRGRGVA